MSSNTEWQKGFEAGYAAGWRASKVEYSYTNFPPVYYGGGSGGNMAYTVATMADQSSYGTVTLNETKTDKVIRNLTDHTRIV